MGRDQARSIPRLLRSIPAVIWGSTLIAAILGWSARGGWQAFLLWVHRQPFGIEDPLHHRDVGFFVFSLPFLDAALEPADPDRRDGLGGGDRHPRTYRRGHPAAAQGHSSRARSPRAARGPRPAPPRLAPAPGDLLGRVEQAHPGQSQAFRGRITSTRTSGCSACAFSPTSQSVGDRARGGAVPRFPGSVAWRETGGDLPMGALAIVAIVSESWAPTLLQRYVVNTNPRQGGSIPGALDRRDPTRIRACGRGRAPVRPQGANHVRRHQARPKSARQRPALGHEHPAPPDAAARKQDAVLPRPASPRSTRSLSGGGSRLTVIGERELDVDHVQGAGRGWNNSRLVYTHGFGAFRFSGTRSDRAGGPRRTTGRSRPAATHLLRPTAAGRAGLGGREHAPPGVRPTTHPGAPDCCSPK